MLGFKFQRQPLGDDSDIISPDTNYLTSVAKSDDIVAKLLHFGSFLADDVLEEGSFGVDLDVWEFTNIQ